MTKRPRIGYSLSDFYCLGCKHMITLPRLQGRTKEKFHLKKIHCVHCKEELNHLEVRDSDALTVHQLNNAIGVARKKLRQRVTK